MVRPVGPGCCRTAGIPVNGLTVSAFLCVAVVVLAVPGPQPIPRRTVGGAAAPNIGSGISDPALMLDLVAAMLGAGQPLPSALALLAGGVDTATAGSLARLLGALELGVPWETAWQLAAGGSPGEPSGTRAGHPRSAAFEALGPALRFTAGTGAPSAAVLYSQADALRRSRRAEGRRRAATLGIRLVVPLGLCSLPAFVALTVVPLLLSLLPGR